MNFSNLDWRKIGLIAGFIIVIIAVAYLLYFLFFTTPDEQIIIEEETPDGQLPDTQRGEQPGITTDEGAENKQIIAEKVIKIQAEQSEIDFVAQGGITSVNDLDYNINQGIILAKNGNDLISYNPGQGKFYTIDNSGNKFELTDKVYPEVEKIAWSAQKDSAILEFPDGSNIYYNFEEDRQVTLPKDWAEFNFNKSGDQIAYKDMNQIEDYRFIGIANPDGSGIKYLESIGGGENDFDVDFSPTGQVVATYNQGSTKNTTRMYLVGKYGEEFVPIELQGYGVETQWVPDGKRLIYSAHNEYSEHKPELYIVNALGGDAGSGHQSLGLQTWADKCTFQNTTTMYCAVPKELPYGADYFPELADEIADYIYRVDLETGVKTFIAEPEYAYTIDQMQVSEDGESLFFTDKATQSLHTIKLK
jgi:Tol biopolymer transport system component